MRYQGGLAKSVGLKDLPMRHEDRRRLRGNGAVGFAGSLKPKALPLPGYYSRNGRTFRAADLIAARI